MSVTTPAASEASTSTSGPTTTDWQTAVQRVRDTASWIVKAFVALAVVLVGSGPLVGNLESLEANSRGVLVLATAGIGLAAIGGVIWLAASVGLTQIVDIGDLLHPRDPDTERIIDHISSDDLKEVYLSGRSVPELVQMRRVNVLAANAATARLAGAAPAVATKLQQNIAQANDNVDQIDMILNNVTGWVGYQRVRGRFDRVRPMIFLLAAIAAVAVMVSLGVLGTSSSTSTSSTSTTGPGTVEGGTVSTFAWRANNASATTLRRTLDFGRQSMATRACETIGVLKSGGTGSEANPWQLTVLPNDPCPVKVQFLGYSRAATLTLYPLLDQAEDKVTLHESSDISWWAVAAYIAVGIFGAGLVLIGTLTVRSRSEDL